MTHLFFFILENKKENMIDREFLVIKTNLNQFLKLNFFLFLTFKCIIIFLT